jgi:hypothetical protein
MILNETMFLCQMFEATGWKLEEPEVADQEKYDLIVPTIVKSPSGRGHDEEVSRAVAMETLLATQQVFLVLCWRRNIPCTRMPHHCCRRSRIAQSL